MALTLVVLMIALQVALGRVAFCAASLVAKLLYVAMSADVAAIGSADVNNSRYAETPVGGVKLPALARPGAAISATADADSRQAILP